MATLLPDLATWVREQEAAGELVRIEAQVDPDLELAEIHRRVIAAGGPALLFERVEGSPYPVVTNLFGTRARVERAFGPRPQELFAELARLPEELVPPSVSKLWAKRGLLARLARVGAAERARGPVSEVVERMSRLLKLNPKRTDKDALREKVEQLARVLDAP